MILRIFLNRDNLEIIEDKPHVFKDNKLGFRYCHEIDNCFEEEYELIYNKYMHRIERFRKAIKQKTCFVRTVKNDEELAYIQTNIEYIASIIKKENSENEIIYIVSSQNICCKNLKFPFFVVDFKYNFLTRKSLRSLFDSNTELQEFCIHNFDENRRMRNLVFDLQQENQTLELIEIRYNLINKIDKIDINKTVFPEKVIIYGIGNLGKRFYQKIKNKCNILYFVDKAPMNNDYEGVPIISFSDFIKKQYENIPIIITVTYLYEDIKSTLLSHGNYHTISMLEYLETK